MSIRTVKIDEGSCHSYGFYGNTIPVYKLQTCDGIVYKFSRMDRGCSSQMIIESINPDPKKVHETIYTNIYRGPDVGKADVLIKPTLLLTTSEQWGGKFVVLNVQTGNEDKQNYCSEINEHVCTVDGDIWMNERPRIITNDHEIVIQYPETNKLYVFSLTSIPFKHVKTLDIDEYTNSEHVRCANHSNNEIYLESTRENKTCIIVCHKDFCHKDSGENIRTIDTGSKQQDNLIVNVNENFIYLIEKAARHGDTNGYMRAFYFRVIDVKTGKEISRQSLKHRAFEFYKYSYNYSSNKFHNKFLVVKHVVKDHDTSEKLYVIDNFCDCGPEGELWQFDYVREFSILHNAA